METGTLPDVDQDSTRRGHDAAVLTRPRTMCRRLMRLGRDSAAPLARISQGAELDQRL